MQEIWGFFWVEFFLGLLSRQGSYGFFGYFPQKVAVFGSELACIQGRGVTATSLRKLRFLGLNWPLGVLFLVSFQGVAQKVAVFGSELACIQGRGVTATSHRKLRFLGLNWPAFKAGELRLLPSESCGFWV